jgi:hypothetical protein
MKEKIQRLIELGMTKEEAEKFMIYIAATSWNGCILHINDDTPFSEWFNEQIKDL